MILKTAIGKYNPRKTISILGANMESVLLLQCSGQFLYMLLSLRSAVSRLSYSVDNLESSCEEIFQKQTFNIHVMETEHFFSTRIIEIIIA